MDSLKCQTSTVTAAEPGVSLGRLGPEHSKGTATDQSRWDSVYHNASVWAANPLEAAHRGRKEPINLPMPAADGSTDLPSLTLPISGRKARDPDDL